MRIALVVSIAPFDHDEDQTVVEETASALGSGGHQVDIVRLPFASSASSLVRQLTAYRTLDLTDFADVMICFDSPAHLVRHPRKIAWYLSRSSADGSSANASLRDSIRRADTAAMGEASRIFAGSESIGRRLREVNETESELLLPRTSFDRQEWSSVADRLLS